MNDDELKKKLDKLPKMTRKEVQKFFEEAEQRVQQRRQRQQEEDSKPKTFGDCAYCGGHDSIVADVREVQDGPIIYGPGNRTYKIINGYYCNNCGLCYHFPPSKK